MGVFSKSSKPKLIGTIAINFYGENEASVEYKTDILDSEQGEEYMMLLFTLYYAKMLFNLDRGEIADELISKILKAFDSVIIENGVNRESILELTQKLVKPKTNGITKKYSGELYEKSDHTRFIQTYMDWGNENYFIPASTIMFLQYLINNLSEGVLSFLMLTLGGMNKYYLEVGDYSDVQSIPSASEYGFNIAMQLLNEKT